MRLWVLLGALASYRRSEHLAADLGRLMHGPSGPQAGSFCRRNHGWSMLILMHNVGWPLLAGWWAIHANKLAWL